MWRTPIDLSTDLPRVAAPLYLPDRRQTESSSADPRARFLSEADCQDIAQRMARMATGGGVTMALVSSRWTGNIRWARNRVSSGGESRNDLVRVVRNVHGATNRWLLINELTDDALGGAVRRAERLVQMSDQQPSEELWARIPTEPASVSPPLFFDATYQLDVAKRNAAAIALVRSAEAAGMLSAGYIEVGAYSMAVIDTVGHVRYCAYTSAECSMTVRDPAGTGSGWAGVDSPDWTKIDAQALAKVALQKCVDSRHPVRVEPGRYTTILEPQAVSDFVGPFFSDPAVTDVYDTWGFGSYSTPTTGPFGAHQWAALKGKQVVDKRISIMADPSDPELMLPPYNLFSGKFLTWDPLRYETYHPFTLIKDGILTELSYDYIFAPMAYRTTLAHPNSGAWRMTGGDTSVEQMIATTERGLLVTRFDRMVRKDLVMRGYTRDGLWLIEHGKITHPAKNMMITESPLFVLNRVEQLGPPQRVYHPRGSSLSDAPAPRIMPPIKVNDFSFTMLADSV